nr:long polar fimbria protein A [Salmonella sp. NCTC 7297]
MLSFIFSTSALSYDGTINFVGKILDQTCSVTTGSKNLTVTLPAVSKTLLDTPAKTASLTPFVIELNGCDAERRPVVRVLKPILNPTLPQILLPGI